MPASSMDSHENTTRLHVDELIFDYLLWYCIDSLLKERKLRQDGLMEKQEWIEASNSADMGMRLVNSFVQTFRRLHPNSTLPDNIALRLRLCRFTTVILRRLDATSTNFAPRSSSARTQVWLLRRHISSVLSEPDGSNNIEHTEFTSATPFPQSHLDLNTQEMHRQMGFAIVPPSQQTFWGKGTLRGVLKEFMVLSAWTSANHAEVSALWMQTAAIFMLQAVLEAYRCDGASGLGALNECFAWGLVPDDPNNHHNATADEDFEELIINEMFAGDGGKVNLEFEAIKNEVLVDILPPPGVHLEAHLDKLAEENPWSQFEDRMVMGYLAAVISAQPLPVLVQLEGGKLAGFEDSDIAQLLTDVKSSS